MMFEVIGRWRNIREDRKAAGLYVHGGWVAVGMYVDANSKEAALCKARALYPEPEYEWVRTIRFSDDWWGNEI